MVFFFWVSLPKRMYLSSRASVPCGPQRTVIFHTISWASLKILPIWLNIFSCGIQLKWKHRQSKHHLFCYEHLSHILVPGYLIVRLDEACPGLGPSHHLSIRVGWSSSLMIFPFFGVVCFHQACRNNLPLRSSFFYLASHPICQVLELLWVWEGADIHLLFILPPSLPREMVEKNYKCKSKTNVKWSK